MMRKTLLLSLLFLSPSMAWSVVRTICASGCDHTTITAAETASGGGDILEIQDSRTYDESWIPDDERTLRSVAGQTPIVQRMGAITVDLDSAGSPVTIDGIDGGLKISSTGGGSRTIQHGAGSKITLVVTDVEIQTDQTSPIVLANLLTTTESSYTCERVKFDGNGKSNIIGIQYQNADPGGTGRQLNVRNCVFFGFKGGTNGRAIKVDGTVTTNAGELINNTIADADKGLDIDEKMVLTNNIFADSGDDIVEAGVFDKNDGTFNIFEEEPSTGWPASNIHGITVDFVNAAAKDFHLSNGTRGVDEGTTTSVTVDFDGDSRPQGPAYDIGMDETLPTIVVKGSLSLLGAGI